MTITLTQTNPKWFHDALCSTSDKYKSVFMQAIDEADDLDIVLNAKQICSRCQVQDECLVDALIYSEYGQRHDYGVFGGADRDERSEMSSMRPEALSLLHDIASVTTVRERVHLRRTLASAIEIEASKLWSKETQPYRQTIINATSDGEWHKHSDIREQAREKVPTKRAKLIADQLNSRPTAKRSNRQYTLRGAAGYEIARSLHTLEQKKVLEKKRDTDGELWMRRPPHVTVLN